MIRALTIAAVLLGGSLAVGSGPNSDSTPFTCDGKTAHFHLYRVETIASKAFDTGRALDASPAKQSEKRAWRAHKFCLAAPLRDRVEKLIDKARDRFDAFYEGLLVPPGRQVLAAIAACESHGNYSTNTGNGYYGAYQFDLTTWATVGGSGLPSDAAPREQDYRAAVLYQRRGASPWPVCGV